MLEVQWDRCSTLERRLRFIQTDVVRFGCVGVILRHIGVTNGILQLASWGQVKSPSARRQYISYKWRWCAGGSVLAAHHLHAART